MVGGVAVVEDKSVFDSKFFEEPEDALGLGVLVAELVGAVEEGERTEDGGRTFIWWKVGLLSVILRDFLLH